MDGESICRLCHEECKFGCTGITNKDCITEDIRANKYDKGCLNVQYGLEFGRCLDACPKGYYSQLTTILTSTFNLCTQCHHACQEQRKHNFFPPIFSRGSAYFLFIFNFGTLLTKTFLNLPRKIAFY